MPTASPADRFNRSGFGRFINSRDGRAFRLAAGTGFLVAGLLTLPSALGIVLLAWSALPLSAGAFDVCWISAALGGPLSGRRIRAVDGAFGPQPKDASRAGPSRPG